MSENLEPEATELFPEESQEITTNPSINPNMIAYE
jgi:hypothetical protein